VVVGNLWSVFSSDCNEIMKNMSEEWFDDDGLLNVGVEDKFLQLKNSC
jgi:hypothetical protein